MRWLVRVRRYTGGESVVSRHEFKSEADRDAQQMNEWYQTDRYYVEEFDPAKQHWPTGKAVLSE